MKSETITQNDELVIRRHVLEPGAATPWHTDVCRRFTVVVRGERLRIEFRDASADAVSVPVSPGMAEWDDPEPRVHRAVNVGSTPYEEVVTFYLFSPGIDPQPQHD